MTTVTITGTHRLTVPASASTVWQKMRNFGDLSWAQGIAEVTLEGEGVGMLRSVRLDGSQDWIPERLVASDDRTMQYSYVLEGQGMPGLDDYRADAGVTPAGDHSEIFWRCSANVLETEIETMQALIQGMAEGMVSLFAAQFMPGEAGSS